MSKHQIILGLAGPKNSGKDTAADLLVTHCGFIKLAFADALYGEISDAFGIDVGQLRQRETKEHPLSALALRKCLADGFVARLIIMHSDQGLALDLDAPRSPRQILQWWGTDYRRRQSENYWVSQASARIVYMLRERIASRFVITDCRFSNEVDMVRSFGGQLWQIARAGITVPEGSHPSETTGAIFKPSAIIHNDHDIRHLQQLVLAEFWAYDAGLAGLKVEIAS